MNAHQDPNAQTDTDAAAAARMERAGNRYLDAATVAEMVRQQAPEAVPHARIVGAWLWVQFPTRPEPETRATLKRLGFSWNGTRGVWQHPGGVFRPRAHSYDPRDAYGEQPIDTETTAAQ